MSSYRIFTLLLLSVSMTLAERPAAFIEVNIDELLDGTERSADPSASDRSWQRKSEAGVWFNGTIPFMVMPTINEAVLNSLYQAMVKIMETSCVKFEQMPWTWDFSTGRKHVKFLEFESTYGPYECSGLSGPPRQGVGYPTGNETYTHFILNSGCYFLETNLHAVLKIAGAEAESSRPDRDNFIKVNWENVIPNQWYLAPLLKAGDPNEPGCDTKWCGNPDGVSGLDPVVLAADEDCTNGRLMDVYHKDCFDFKSIMLYNPYMHSKGWWTSTLPTMTSKIPGFDIGYNTELSAIDKHELNTAYSCSSTPVEEPECPYQFVKLERSAVGINKTVVLESVDYDSSTRPITWEMIKLEKEL